jgi:hypothetical protein
VAGVLFFGSRRTKASPGEYSAWDFFVVVDGYRPFYAALARASRVRRNPRLLALANSLLPPSQISLRLPDGRGGDLHAKCTIISLAHFRRETGVNRRDHFTIGRLYQPVEVLFARDETARDGLLDGLAGAAAATYGWGRPFLPPSFDTETYLRTLLQVSLAREIRPEPTGQRAETLHQAQRDEQLPVYGALLEALTREGELRMEAGGPEGAPFALVRPAGFLERLRVAAYFRLSTIRATLRWFKYVFTFDDWLTYIRRKAERHTGQPIELSARERAHPLVFLWPRLVRYLRHKDDPLDKNGTTKAPAPHPGSKA